MPTWAPTMSKRSLGCYSLNEFALVQISDLHYAAPASYSLEDLGSKRALGGMNVMFSRRF